MDRLALTPVDAERFWAKVDQSGECWIWQAAIVRKYGMFTVCRGGKRRMVKAHRVAYELTVGPIPQGHGLDHRCHNEACVNPKHLRPVTAKQNAEHRVGANSNSTSGVRGVHKGPRPGTWKVTIGHNGEHYSGGTFTDIEEAANAARALRARLFTHSDHDTPSILITK